MQSHAKGCQESLKTKGQAEGSCPSKCSEGIRPVYTLTSDLLSAELKDCTLLSLKVHGL